MFWVATASMGIAGFVLTAPEATSQAGPKKAPVKKKSTSKLSVFTEEDEKAEFAPVQVEFKNAFMPIVKREGGKLSDSDGAANAIPRDFAGSDGWVYTGSAEIDGAPSALLENRTTGDGVFLKAGERWKSCSVVKIMPDSVVLRGPTGTKTFTLVSDEPIARGRSGGSVPPAAVNVPNNMRGNINPNGMGGFPTMNAMPQGGMNSGAVEAPFSFTIPPQP